MLPTPKRRWFQFSLRTLLIVVTLAGSVLGAGMAYVAPAERQRGFVQRVEGLGGRVVYYEPPTNEWWAVAQLRQWLPRDYFDPLEVVDLHGKPATDAELGRMRSLSRLRLLLLDDTKVTDAGLVHLQKLQRLHGVWLRNTRVSEQGLAALQTALPHCEIYDRPATDPAPRRIQ